MEQNVPLGRLMPDAEKRNLITLVLPACCFAPIHWYLLFYRRANTIIDTYENYRKQTFRNRFEICSSQGRQTISIPVAGQSGVKTPLKDIRLSEGNWRKIHFASIRSAYGKSAFFIHIEEELQRLFDDRSVHFLIDFNEQAFRLMAPFITQLPAHWTESRRYVEKKQVITDGRDWWEPAQQWPALPSYPQVFSDRHPFLNNLSILDVIMNLGPETSRYLDTASSHFVDP
ncbi:MAG: WbqC family protein [Crocinitomicaceae bacterium]|nr:WbqC family protein [Crocinitomicaceae bacterium]